MNNGLPTNSVRALGKSGSMIFAGTYGNGVYVTANNGTNWTQVNNGLTDLHVISLTGNDSKIFAGTDAGGVFLSVDNGLNWIQVNESLSYLNIPLLAICGSYVFAGTTNGGIWKRPVSEFTMIKEINSNSSITIYPNPASDIVTMNIDNTDKADLTLNIYNIIGALVKSEIIKQNQQQINVGDLDNGIYMIEIKSKEWIENQKLIIKR
jgi:hypothetical protein